MAEKELSAPEIIEPDTGGGGHGLAGERHWECSPAPLVNCGLTEAGAQRVGGFLFNISRQVYSP